MSDTIFKNKGHSESSHLNQITINMLVTSHLCKHTHSIISKEFHRHYFYYEYLPLPK